MSEQEQLFAQIEGSRKNIEEHYDAGNAMYKLFLDPSLTYSSGIHRPGKPAYNLASYQQTFLMLL